MYPASGQGMRLLPSLLKQSICGQLRLRAVVVFFTVKRRFGLARGFGAFGAEFFDQGFAVGAEAQVVGGGVVDACFLGSPRNDSVIRSDRERRLTLSVSPSVNP